MKFIYIIFLLLPTTISANQDSILTEGYFVNSTSSDKVKVERSGDRLILTMGNGSNINLDLFEGKYRHQNIFGDSHLELIIKNPEKFKLVDRRTSNIAEFSLAEKLGIFNKLITILVGSALLISIFQAYLKVNKIWKRKKIEDVANSISIVASLLGFAVLLPFLLNSLINTNDYPAAGKSLIGLILAALWSLISMGYFVESNRGKGLFRLLIDALTLEKKEHTNLIFSILSPPDEQKIIQILIKLSAIDDEVAIEEIKLIKEFADKWGIDIPNLKPGKPEEVTNLVDLNDLVQSYLDEKPEVEVAKGLRDIITLMTEADHKVTLEESIAVAEFSGMISNYINTEKDRKVDMFEVNIVPQGEKQLRAIKELLPKLKSVHDRGGEVFKIGDFYSEEYSDAVCEKYIDLGIYSNTVKIKAPPDKVVTI
jgi:hypothetical protein